MIIEFKVKNFRSIGSEQTLSLVATKADKTLPSYLIDPHLRGMAGIKILKGAALYGANASGKSNILLAMQFLKSFILRSATKIDLGDETGVEPFKLDEASRLQPTEFELAFVVDGVRYIFRLILNARHVLEESLIAYTKGSPQEWYRRVWNFEEEKYSWSHSSSFKRDKSLEKKTRENALLLSVAAQFNHPQLSPLFTWFKKKLRHISLGVDGGLSQRFSIQQFHEGSSEDRMRMMNLLRSADLSVVDAQTYEEDWALPEGVKDNLTPSRIQELENRNKGKKEYRVALKHAIEGREPVTLDFFDEESAGTQRFFSLVGPWIDILENGYTVFVDEIETSLHPLLVKELLKMFFSESLNSKGAQIIFTTHNSILLDTSFIRRDQIWFTEKSPRGETHLYPLTDYQPRKGEALAKGYLAGRYGGIPFIPEGLRL